uniref:Cyanophage baseplate Pam3 plug gp18 domain-containing protein n=1 Tax=viral metagenome TaxID=1070528 RepID=A0A6M3M4K8_9ZZZZ
MAFILTTFPQLPDTTQTVTVGEQQYAIRLYWRERLQGWYMSIWLADGTAVLLGRRLSSDYGPMIGIVPLNRPAGEFLVQGPSGYNRLDLGSQEGAAMLLWYFGVEDFPASTSDDLDMTYTVP